jgi:hypothetical protein
VIQAQVPSPSGVPDILSHFVPELATGA